MKQIGYAIICIGVPMSVFRFSPEICTGVVLVGFVDAAIGIVTNYRRGGQ